MITRSQMRRQLRAKGGIMNVASGNIGGGGYTGIPMGSRTGFGIISKIKDRVRKLIPNELADVAVKAAPFIAPFFPGYAAIARGLGRFDQRGSISDALKQGLGTYAFGKGARYLGGAEGATGGPSSYSLEGFKQGPVGRMFQGGKKPTDLKESTFFDDATVEGLDKIKTPATTGKGLGFVKEGTKFIKDLPIIRDLPPLVQQQILVGGVTSAGTYLYQKFLADEPPQEEGETMEEYLARRKVNVGKKMRSYFDNYFKFDKEYSSLDDAGKDAFVARYNMMSGGRAGYQTGGITMANTLAENMRRNLANQQAVAQQFQAARSRLPGYVAPQRIAAPTPTPIKPDMPIGIPERPGLFPQPPSMPITQPIEPPGKIMPIDAPTKIIQPGPGGVDNLLPDLYEKVTQPVLEESDEGTLGPVTTMPTGPGLDTPIGTLPGFTVPGGPEAEIMPTLPVEPQTDQDLIEGFAKFKEQNPEAMQGMGIAAIQEGVLPGGTPITFSGGVESGAFNKYLESLGQLPFKRVSQTAELTKLNDPMMTGFDYSKEINWSPGQPAPEGYRVVNMMGDEFLERKFPSKEEVARLPMSLMGPGMMPPLNAPEDPDAGLSGQEYAEKYGIPYALGGRVGFSEGANLKIKLKQIGYEDTLLDGMSIKELRELLDSEKGTFTDQGTYREPGNMGGIMGMPMGEPRVNKGGITELDFRAKGGFVPVGIKEKADDVPAMLSKNEFVFTADAVRGAGNGSVEKGAQKMYDTMKNLERRVT